jgi:hypothetical protein
LRITGYESLVTNIAGREDGIAVRKHLRGQTLELGLPETDPSSVAPASMRYRATVWALPLPLIWVLAAPGYSLHSEPELLVRVS